MGVGFKIPAALEIEILRLFVIECGDGHSMIDVPFTAIFPGHTGQKSFFKVALELSQVVTDQRLPLPALFAVFKRLPHGYRYVMTYLPGNC